MAKKRVAKRRHRATKPPFSMYGSKQRMLPRLLAFVSRAPHKIYVEVFGGTGALLLAKPRSPYEVYNDLNSGFVDMFRVIRDEKKFELFRHLVEYTPYAKEEWEEARDWKKLPRGSVERAVAFFILMSLSFRGGMSSPHFARSKGSGENTAKTYDNAIRRLPLLHNRFRGVTIENEDFEKLIPRYDRKDALFYCDPPYVAETRRKGSVHVYEHEMTNKQHKSIVTLLNKCKGKVILSGYVNNLYKGLEGFTRYDFEHSSTIGHKHKTLGAKRIESIWINF